MSQANKKKFIYFLIGASVFFNFLLMVNVFALRRVNKGYRKYRSAKLSQQVETLPITTVKKMTPGEENMVKTNYALAKEYEIKGDRAFTMKEKTDNYSLALLEYAKLPKKVPHYARLIREARERIQPKMLGNKSVVINLGDTRKKVESVYGIPEYEMPDNKYAPSGIVTYYHYDEKGIVVGMCNNRVFSLKLCSNFPGVWHGIQINDEFSKLKSIYPGKKLRLSGNNFGYKVDDLKTTFVFVDADEKIDSMKIIDKQYFGKWKLALK